MDIEATDRVFVLKYEPRLFLEKCLRMDILFDLIKSSVICFIINIYYYKNIFVAVNTVNVT